MDRSIINNSSFNKNIAFVIASYQPNKDASDLLRTAIVSILNTINENVSLWVIDIGSPDGKYLVSPEEFPQVNFVYRKFQIRSYGFALGKKTRIKEILKLKFIPDRHGSYAQGYMFDYIVKYFKKINYNPEYFITSHQDIIILSKSFFNDLVLKFEDKTFAVGVLKQTNYSNEFEILHAVCCMWKYKYILKSKYGFKPDMPKFDVGEKIVKEFIDLGLNTNNLSNSYNDKDVLKKIEQKYKDVGEGVDIAINDLSDVIFMHLGRGVVKSVGEYDKKNKTNVQGWKDWYNKNADI